MAKKKSAAKKKPAKKAAKKAPAKKTAAKKPAAKKASAKKAPAKQAEPVPEPKPEPAVVLEPTPTIGDPSYQDKDIRLDVLIKSIVVTLVVVAISFVAMLFMYKIYDKHLYTPDTSITPLEAPRGLPPADGPRLQVYEKKDLDAFQKYEDELLTTPGWADKENGKVRIPIEDAKKLLLEQGLKSREAGK